MEVALQSYEGALLLVSHDRHLLRNSVEELLLVRDGRVEEYREDLGGYEQWILSTFRPDRPAQQAGADTSRRERRQRAAALRDKLRPLNKALEQVERRMTGVAEELLEVRDRLADPDLYTDAGGEALAELVAREGRLKAEAGDLEERWLELQQALEDLQTA